MVCGPSDRHTARVSDDPPGTGASAVIRVVGLNFTYPGADAPAIRGIDFTIRKGEIFGFLGPNGAGKSTTQNIMIGLLRDYRGRVEAFGRDLSAWGNDLYERIGVGFELPNHYLKLTARENLAYFASLYDGDTETPEAVLESVDLTEAADQRVAEYSKGMRTRLNLARALLPKPEMLYLDEPTGGLDPVSAARVRSLVKERRASGTTVFLTTHDMGTADELCDRVAFIVAGKIVLIDAPRTLKLEHGRPEVRLEYRDGGELRRREFPLEGLGDSAEFLQLLRTGTVETVHTLETDLGSIFIEVTGQRLR